MWAGGAHEGTIVKTLNVPGSWVLALVSPFPVPGLVAGEGTVQPALRARCSGQPRADHLSLRTVALRDFCSCSQMTKAVPGSGRRW